MIDQTEDDADYLTKATQEAAQAILKAEMESDTAAALTKGSKEGSETDSEAETDSDDDFDDDFDPDETFSERIHALKDIFPPQLRSIEKYNRFRGNGGYKMRANGR